MEGFSPELFSATPALIGAVIIIAALLSGLIERSGVPQVAAFLALGAILGPAGLGLIDLTLESPILRTVAILSLVLVLFTDAVSLNLREVRRHALLAFLVLGPGTLLSALLVALVGRWLLDLSPLGAAVLGAALASTDPILLRGLLRSRYLSEAVRQPLRLESGLNDAVLLPIVLFAMALLARGSSLEDAEWMRMGLKLFLLGPGTGVAVGLLAVAMLDLVRRRIGVRRDYESLYSLGVAFCAYAAAEALHGSGFLAAFTAGLTIAALDVELCDCFLEYGETTAEMALLFTFILFGTSLIWQSGFSVLSGETLLFALAVLLVRPVVYLASLAGTPLTWRDRLLIAWFGPRGLSSLLLVLLPVFAGLPGSREWFALCCLVVLLSVLVHGGSLVLLGHRVRQWEWSRSRAESRVPLPSMADSVSSAEAAQGSGDFAPVYQAPDASNGNERLSIDGMLRLQHWGAKVWVIDARRQRSYEKSTLSAAGNIRLPPEHPVERARELVLPPHAWLVVFCDCPNEETSGRVARELRQAGWPYARALEGGWRAWQASGLPTAPKTGAPEGTSLEGSPMDMKRQSEDPLQNNPSRQPTLPDFRIPSG